jgi:hypothetical protein
MSEIIQFPVSEEQADTEAACYEKLCERIGTACDLWQFGQITDEEYLKLMLEFGAKWLEDQIENTPSNSLQ